MRIESDLDATRGDLAKLQEWTNKLIDESLRASRHLETRVQSTTVFKIKPKEPTRFDGSQDLKVVTHFLEEVEHYVQQGASMCPKANLDNQLVDTI